MNAEGVERSYTNPSVNLSSEDLRILERKLLKKREELREEIETKEEILHLFNTIDITDGEQVIQFVQEVRLGLKDLERMADLILSQRRYLDQIQRALYRIRKGTYGICTVTGKPISRERLWQFPHTALCEEALNKDEPKWEKDYAIF